MNKAIKLDKIIDDDIFDLFPVDKSPVLPNEVQVLHKYEHFNLEFILILHKGVLDDNVSLGWSEVDLFLLVLLVGVVE